MDNITEKVNLIQIAQQLQKPRRFSSTTHEKGNFRRRHTEPALPVNLSLSLKVNQWLGSADSGINIDQPDFCRFDSIDENNVFCKTPDDSIVNILPQNLKEAAKSCTNFSLESVFWQTENCDLLLQATASIFPVHKCLLVKSSGYFRQAVVSMETANKTTLVMNVNFSREEISRVLSLIYDEDKELVGDRNVASLLQLARQFEVKKLFKQCVRHLETSPTFNPIIAIQLSVQYSLHTVLECACVKLSRIDCVEESTEFQCLDYPIQNMIMKYALRRFRQGKNAISAHTFVCGHHDNEDCETCCFRTSTRGRENDIEFVKMEYPAEKILACFETAFEDFP